VTDRQYSCYRAETEVKLIKLNADKLYRNKGRSQRGAEGAAAPRAFTLAPTNIFGFCKCPPPPNTTDRAHFGPDTRVYSQSVSARHTMRSDKRKVQRTAKWYIHCAQFNKMHDRPVFHRPPRTNKLMHLQCATSTHLVYCCL